MRHAILALAATLGLAATSPAATITYQFSGVLDTIEGDPKTDPPFTIGQAFAGTFYFQSEMPASVVGADAITYDPAGSFPMSVQIAFEQGRFEKDSIDSSGHVTVATDRLEVVSGFLTVLFTNSGGTAFDTLGLPLSLSGGQFTEGRVTIAGVGGSFLLSGAVDLGTLAPPPPTRGVPEPSTLALGGLGLGLLGVGWLRRVRTS